MSQAPQIVERPSPWRVVAAEVRRVARRYWRSVAWAVVWVAAVVHATDGITAPVMLLGLLAVYHFAPCGAQRA